MKFLKSNLSLVLKIVVVALVVIAILIGLGKPAVNNAADPTGVSVLDVTFGKNASIAALTPSWAGIIALLGAVVAVALLFIPVKKNIGFMIAAGLLVVSAILMFILNQAVYVSGFGTTERFPGLKLGVFAILAGIFYLLAASTAAVLAFKKK